MGLCLQAWLFRSADMTGGGISLHRLRSVTLILDPHQKEKWPFLVDTECGQELEQAGISLHSELGDAPGDATLHGERGRGPSRLRARGDLPSSCPR